jgi:HEAT repeat protein
MKNKDWFMRSAALRVLPLIDQDRAYDEALKALGDKALVVRSQAVDTLARLNRSESAPRLWEELYSKDNYMHKRSLWIRKKIVATLADVAPAGSEARFIKSLSDADASLYEPAIRGLERLTGQKLGDQNMHPNFKRHLWQKWFEAHGKKTEKSS